MKHVLVIETVDVVAGGRKISSRLEGVLVRALEIGVEEAPGPCFIQSRFNVSSALAALHELYGVPNCQHPEGI